MPSVEAVVHVDPALETIQLYERVGPNAWRETSVDRGGTLRLQAIGTELSANDMFRRD